MKAFSIARRQAVRRAIADGPFRAVYVVGPEEDIAVAKIGVADDPYKRISSIQTGNWNKLLLRRYWWLKTPRDALKLEAAVLDACGEARSLGEWVRLPHDELSSLVTAVAQKIGLSLLEDSDLERMGSDLARRDAEAVESRWKHRRDRAERMKREVTVFTARHL